jgi:hypothetical protein
MLMPAVIGAPWPKPVLSDDFALKVQEMRTAQQAFIAACMAGEPFAHAWEVRCELERAVDMMTSDYLSLLAQWHMSDESERG